MTKRAEKLLLLKQADIYRGPLILVNVGYPVRSGGFPLSKGLTEVSEEWPEILLEARAAALLRELICRSGGWKEICPVSGYRTRREQVEIWEGSFRENGEAYTRKYVARPDCSEHQTGLAVDLAKRAETIDFICPDFPDEGVCAELRRLAPGCGFIERYPKEKQKLTGIGWEPWHFRYVGYPHSVIMKERGFCLEEYIRFLSDYPAENPLIWRDSQREFEIFHVPAKGRFTPLKAPETGVVLVSGNNVDGFIVTIWR
ncbi:MAG: M15 family metallopeptidase [Lachnospiraceae bacterium]|nr:M15 family metallopeptidase [Lachnospiraceae bacterium]